MASKVELLRRLIGELKKSQGGNINEPRPVPKADQVDLEKIVDFLPLDDRGKRFDPAMAKADHGYFMRHRATTLSFLGRLDTEKRKLEKARTAGELAKQVALGTARREGKDIATRTAATEAAAVRFKAEEARWEKK